MDVIISSYGFGHLWKVALALLLFPLEVVLIDGSLAIPSRPTTFGNCSANMTALPILKQTTNERSASKMEKALTIVLASDFIRQIQHKEIHRHARKQCSDLNGTYIEDSGYCVRMRIVGNGTTPCETPRVYDSIFVLDVAEKQRVEYWLYITGNILSLLSTMALLITYVIDRELQTSYGKCILLLSANTMLQQVMQILSLYANRNTITYCTTIAVLHHWSYLVMFSWMASIAFDFAITFSRLRKPSKELQRRRFRVYTVVSEGIPTIVIIVCVLVDFSSHKAYVGYGERSVCFITNYVANIVLFSVPIGCMIIFNILCLGTALIFIVKTRYKSRLVLRSNRRKSHITIVILTLKLSLLLGIGWTFGPIARVTRNQSVLCIYIFFNSFQGAFIFVAFCINQKVLHFYKQIMQAAFVKRSSYEHEITTGLGHETDL